MAVPQSLRFPSALIIPMKMQIANAVQSTFDSILSSFNRSSVHSHQPSFRLEREGTNWQVFDGQKHLACFMPQTLDIWSFSPFEQDEMANLERPVKVVDVHTAHNTCINFGMQGWPAHWNPEELCWNWEKDAGAELVANITLSARDGETGSWRLRVSYDPAWERYRYQITIDARKMDPDGFEGFNLMAAGALACRPEDRRWSHSIWENPDGKLRRIVHSNALLMCTDFGGLRDSTGPWLKYHLSYPQAWVGYAAHPSFNPACLIHRTNIPLRGNTCNLLFDEHIVWTHAGQDHLGEDGYFHYHMDLEFVNLLPGMARQLLDLASDPVRPKKWWNERVALPFRMDVENSFEEPADPWLPEECPIFEVPIDVEGVISWCDDSAHSGTHSIRLRQAEAGRLQLVPGGAVCRVRPHTLYRLSAWVKTKELPGRALVELAGYAYSYDNINHKAASSALCGDADWTFLEVNLDSGDQAYLMPYLILEGPGTAWFDDVTFSPVTEA